MKPFTALTEGFIRAAERWPEVAENVGNRAVGEGVTAVMGGIHGADLISTGKLLRSIKGRVTTEGKDAGHRIVGSVYSTAGDEALAMDLGRKPGADFPKLGGIKSWIVANRGSFRLFLTKSGKARKVSDKAKNAAERRATGSAAEREVDRIAFLIGRHIQEHGTEGRHYFDSLKDVWDPTSLKTMAREAVDSYLGEVFA